MEFQTDTLFVYIFAHLMYGTYWNKKVSQNGE